MNEQRSSVFYVLPSIIGLEASRYGVINGITTVHVLLFFTAHVLPEDDGEFYQFCYVGGGQVRGASVPFQFKSPRGEDFVEIEGDEDLMIVRTKTAVLQVSLIVSHVVIGRPVAFLYPTRLDTRLPKSRVEGQGQ